MPFLISFQKNRRPFLFCVILVHFYRKDLLEALFIVRAKSIKRSICFMISIELNEFKYSHLNVGSYIYLNAGLRG